jgi:rSAM/selenodomain-associated transferase 2
LSCDERPELSVIVPVLNEGGIIPPFLHHLSLQQQVRLELVLSDGGSGDEGIAQAKRLAGSLPFPITILEGSRGRGEQMNRGAEAARGATLLFLHVDSSFSDPLSFRKGLDALFGAGRYAAAHYALEFRFDGATPLPYRFYAAKARLNRPGCTHGDQGLMIKGDFFAELGGFQGGLPVMEDTFLADRIRNSGSLLLIPACIKTSPRRFLTEGLLPRQTLNAILMDLAHIGDFDLIGSLSSCYRSQGRAAALSLRPFLERLEKEIAELPVPQRRRLWRETGRYVRGNAWQIPFYFDFLLGDCEAGKGGMLLSLHDRVMERLLDNKAADLAAAALVWLWFRLALLVSR